MNVFMLDILDVHERWAPQRDASASGWTDRCEEVKGRAYGFVRRII